jgi:hypothetical protein
MIPMRMVQSSIDKVIDVVAMRHGLVSAGWAMRVATTRLWRAVRGVGLSDWDDVFIHMVPVHVVEMAVVKIIDMPFVEDRRMPTAGTMLVSVVGMMFLVAGGHNVLLSRLRSNDMGR